MIRIVEKEKMNEAFGSYEKVSRDVFLQKIKASLNKQMSLFEVGPDEDIITDCKSISINSNMLLLNDNGFIAGIDLKKIPIVNMYDTPTKGTVFNFNLGRREFKLFIGY